MTLDLDLDEAPVLADLFMERIEWVGLESARRTRLEVEEFRDFEAPEMWERVAAYARQTRAAVADAVRARRLPTEFPADEVSLRLGFTGGASLRTMLQSYRIAQAVAAEAWTDAVIANTRDASQAGMARELAAFLFAYEDRLVDWMHSRWEEYSRREDSSPSLIASARRVLEGDVAAGNDLDYSLATDHVAVIAWGPDAIKELTRIGVSHAGPSLVLRATADLCWGWYARREWGGEQLDLGAVSAAGVVGLAMGGPASGFEGFRRAHDEAGDAYVVARRMGRRAVSYGEVAIEALAIRSEASSRRFVAHTLGDLVGEGRRNDVLRATLRAYYQRGQNGAATAQDLGVHEQTVARRLASAAQLLHSHPSECRAEVETALRIREMLGSREPVEDLSGG